MPRWDAAPKTPRRDAAPKTSRRNAALLPAAFVAAFLTASLLLPARARAIGPSSRVEVVQLLLPGQPSGAHPGLARVILLLQERTNVSMAPHPKTVRAYAGAARSRRRNAGSGSNTHAGAAIARHPLLWTISSGPLPRLSAATTSGLREAIRRGGTWVIDGPSEAAARPAFLASVRRALRRILPGGRLTRLRGDHTLFKSFYLLAPARFRRRWGSIHALTRDRRAAVVVVHGLAAALARPGDALGREWQRRLAVNLVLYALCVDYKSDQVHAAAILRRRDHRGDRRIGHTPRGYTPGGHTTPSRPGPRATP